MKKAMENKGEPRLIGFSSNLIRGKSQKPTWYEGRIHPVVGTSLFLEIDCEKGNLRVIGLSETQLYLERKYFGSVKQIKAVPIIKVEDNNYREVEGDNKRSSIKRENG